MGESITTAFRLQTATVSLISVVAKSRRFYDQNRNSASHARSAEKKNLDSLSPWNENTDYKKTLFVEPHKGVPARNHSIIIPPT